MEEIEFHVEETPGGGFRATALGAAICVESDTLDALPRRIGAAVAERFGDPGSRPQSMRLCFLADSALVSICTLPMPTY